MNPLSDNVLLIVTISLIIIFSPFIAKLLKLPTTPIEIILGSILGYIGFLHDEHLFEIVAELGFLYLMFIAGTEINLKHVLKNPQDYYEESYLLSSHFIHFFY